MHYLKIDDNKIVEAPYEIEKDGKTIYGYNKDNNIAMLTKDGYSAFDYPAGYYTIVNNQIIPRPITPPEPKTTFTKLQIRRAMRKLNKEYLLDMCLSTSIQFNREWSDAIEIDVTDPMIQQAIVVGIISQQDYDDIIQELNNDYTE